MLSLQTLITILKNGKKFAKEDNKPVLASQIQKVLDNMKTLEAEGLISKNDNYAAFLRLEMW